MNLKQWRAEAGLTMTAAAALLALESPRTYQRYENGENRPDAPLAEKIAIATDGKVTVQDLHEQRLEWLRENRPEVFASIPEAAE